MTISFFLSVIVPFSAGIQKVHMSSAPAQAESLKGLGNKSYKVSVIKEKKYREIQSDMKYLIWT